MTQHHPSHERHRHGEGDPHCLEVFARLSEYVDGELDEQDCRLIEEHMAGCEPCIEFLRSLRRSIEAAHTFQPHVEPARLPPEVEARLKSAWMKALGRRTAS